VTPVILFLAVLAGVAAWWLSQQRLMAKPWLEEGPTGGFPDASAPSLPTAKIGLGVFLAVASCLFALFISAYFMRRDMADWRPLPAPRLLWFNTFVLILSSVALHWAQIAARRGRMDDVRTGLLAGGVFAIAFLAGQLIAWRQLSAEGYSLASNPANAFFYLITGVHGLHLLGGLVAWGRTAAKAWGSLPLGRVRLSVELCAIYWHFLLVVWLILFALLMRWADDFITICRQLLA
jgi:cytochrome c oxidase subunit III